jgi:hypothetical protein
MCTLVGDSTLCDGCMGGSCTSGALMCSDGGTCVSGSGCM